MKRYLRSLLKSLAVSQPSKSGDRLPGFIKKLSWPKALQFNIPRTLELKIEITFTLILLLVLSAFNFYGMHTDRFYFGIPENYVFTSLSLFNIWYVRLLWRKLHTHKVSYSGIRNTELVMYVVWIGYGYLMIDAIVGVQETLSLSNYIIADSYYIRSYCMIVLYGLLMLLNIRTFLHRKTLFGSFSYKKKIKELENWSPNEMSK